jgi:flavin-dependent dehydrogenase
VDREVIETDVMVVGAGPAGLAAGIAARQKGFRVTIVDPAHPPIDKACGEGVMPYGVRALGQLGVGIMPHASFPLRGIRFSGGGVSVDAAFPNGGGFGVRRTTLYQALMDRARETGVSIRWGARVRAPEDEPVSINGNPVRYTWLIGADGMNSQIGRWARLKGRRRGPMRFGFRRHFRVKPWTDYVDVSWGQHGQIFTTPVSPEEVCVAFLTRDPRLRLADQLPWFPEAGGRLRNARPTSVERGALCSTYGLRSVARGRVALVGDASGSVDAVTGEGLSLAFQEAVALAEALARNDLEFYQEAHRRITRMPALLGRLMVTMDGHARLRRRALQGLAAEPGMFSRLLAMHLGVLPPAAFGVRGAVSLGWRLLTA